MLGEPFPSVHSMNESRTRHLKARMKDDYWRENWREAMTRMALVPFCTGYNERKWIANIDWFLRPNTVPRLMENFYGEPKATADRMKIREGEQLPE